MTASSCTFTSITVPRARRVLAAKPLQSLKLASGGCFSTSHPVKLVALAPEPLQRLDVAPHCSVISSRPAAQRPAILPAFDIQLDPLAPQPLHRLHGALKSGEP